MIGIFQKSKKTLAGTLAVGVFAFGLAITAGPASSEETMSSIVRGGLLYDKWWKEAGVDEPSDTHEAYGSDGSQEGSGTWRCKECHGWDYKGVNGAYSSGSHFSGIIGINGMAGADTDAIIAVLTDDNHALADLLADEDFQDLANFVSAGQVDTDQFIDAASKTAIGGDVDTGEVIYNSTCARCHGADGSKPKDMGKTLGAQMSNPWEVMHKIMNGHPGQNMPAFRVFGDQVAVDVLTYLATMPKE